jgi:hypothetical protein
MLLLRRYAGLALALGCLGLTACGSRAYYVMDPPKEAFSQYGSIEVKQFTVDGIDTIDPDKRAKAMELATLIADQLRERLGPTYFSGGGKKLVVNGKLVGFDPGSQALRYWVGFGAGSGEIIAEAYFGTENGEGIAKAMGKGSVSGGWFGGSLSSAAKRVAKAIVDFVVVNHAEIRDRESHPGIKK